MSDDLASGLLFDDGSYPEAAGRMSLAGDELGGGLADSAGVQGEAGKAMEGWAPTAAAGAELDRLHGILDGALKQATEVTGRDASSLLETRAAMSTAEHGIVSDISDIHTDAMEPEMGGDGVAGSGRSASTLSGPGDDPLSADGDGSGTVQPGSRPRMSIGNLDLDDQVKPEYAEFLRYLDRTYGERLVIHEPSDDLRDWSYDVRGNITRLYYVAPGVHERVAQYLDAHGGNAGLYFGEGGVPGLDDLSHLAGTTPPGWHEGATWDSVPGAYNRDMGVVAVGTLANPGQSPTLHEFGHLVDNVYAPEGSEAASSHASWQSVYEDVLRKAPPDTIMPYYLQPGRAGQIEMFAGAFDRYYRPEAEPGLADLAGSDAGGQALKRYFDTLFGPS